MLAKFDNDTNSLNVEAFCRRFPNINNHLIVLRLWGWNYVQEIMLETSSFLERKWSKKSQWWEKKNQKI